MRNRTFLNVGLSLCATINALYPGAVAAQAEAEPPPPQHTIVGEVFAPTDVDFSHPLYETAFDSLEVLDDWSLEGGKSANIENGKLVLESHPSEDPDDRSRNHLVYWLKREVPSDFMLEFSVCPQNRKWGLNIVFFNARGVNGEDIFEPPIQSRDGLFKLYHSGDLNNYHVSYWAGNRGTANLRKNKGFNLVSEGKDLIAGAPAEAFQIVRIYKRGGKIRITVDGALSVAYDDDGTTFGPVLMQSGWIGLRQMGHTLRCEYGYLKVFSLQPGRVKESVPINWQQPAQGGKTLGVAHLTQDSTVRDWGNYHNAQNWSYQGRYLVYTRLASDGEQFGKSPEVRLFDLHTGRDRVIDKGSSPRWAHHRNRLFYVKHTGETAPGGPSEVWWYDADKDRKVRMGTGMSHLGGVSMDDKWVFGGVRYSRGTVPRSQSMRMIVGRDSKAETLEGLDTGTQWIPNPTHNVVFTRVANRDDQPFVATRYWYDIDGGDVRIGSVSLTRCHQSWSGDGEYFLLGNSQVRGRHWDAPFPSSLHFLAAVDTGDVSPCGRSGRFIVGDKPLTIADLRSGDGWKFLEDLSIICYPDTVSDDSGPYDSDIKGSPDGTKVSFVSNYDLVHDPVTFITENGGKEADRIDVLSTEMFPLRGTLVVNREVIGYSHKTATSFEGVSRKLHYTVASPLRKGSPVTSFEARLIPEDKWKTLPIPASEIIRSMGGIDTPLIRQKSTDLWAAIVRLPDRPWLRETGYGVELLPGESHYETLGYYLYRNGARIAPDPLRPGESIRIAVEGEYSAVAVEWSGLESRASIAITIAADTELRILREQPADFSWIRNVWSIDGEVVTRIQAYASSDARMEIVHLYDGVISRAWYRWGEILKRHDLNEAGIPIRRLAYHQGRLFRREYHNRVGQHLSTEFLDEKGFVTEMIRYRYAGAEGGGDVSKSARSYTKGRAEGKRIEYDHWWYDDGMPVRRIGMRPARRIESETPVMYAKAGNRWILMDHVGKFTIKNDDIGEGWSRDAQRAIETQERALKNR